MATTLEKQINLQKVARNTYTASWHEDWTVASTFHGGCVAAVIHHAASMHLQTDKQLQSRNQPHVLNLHLGFVRACERADSTITIATLQVGAIASTIQLHLSQKDQLKIVALATSTNFDKSLGPTTLFPALQPPSWSGLVPPLPKPLPNFGHIVAQKPDVNWAPACLAGEIIPTTGRIQGLYPVGGFAAPNICDAWHRFVDEPMNDTSIAFMTDLVPSMSDTLLQNGGLYDAHMFREEAEKWAAKNPGTTCLLTNTIAQAANSTTLNSTLTLDMEFKRALPKEGLRFVLVRTAAKMLSAGRMDIDVTICDEDLGLVCTSRQVILVLEAQRKFTAGKRSAESRI